MVDSASAFAGTAGQDEAAGPADVYWHVRSNGPTASSPWSATRTFQVVRGVAAEEAPDRSSETALVGAFCNPSPSRRRSVLTLAERADVSLVCVVYDVLGKEVARLANGDSPAGDHEATFLAGALAPGIYLITRHSGHRPTSQVVIAR